MAEPGSSSELPPPDDDQMPSSEARTWQSNDLLQGSQMVLIEHRGEIYQLRVTRQGKLVLHK